MGRRPRLWEALVSLLVMIVSISVGVIVFDAEPQIPMLLGVFAASIMALKAGNTWSLVETGMITGVANSLQAILILLLIGVLIGVWILTGVVPTLLYYGLKVFHPAVFLPATLIICSVTSLATGSSWGTSGTIGVALMGVGQGLGFPLPLVAGTVLSGAYFGDKMSPLSDTTNLAPAMTGTDLYTHIRHMAYTTGVTYTITLVLNVILGFFYGHDGGSAGRIDLILKTIDGNFAVSPLLILPALLVIVSAWRKMPSIPSITIGILSAALLGALIQGSDYGQILTAGYRGFASTTGVPVVDDLLSKGGMTAMLDAVTIVICALMYGGVMERSGQLQVIVASILKRARSRGGLITATALSGIGANVVLCDQYMAIFLSGRMFAEEYRRRGLHSKNLSRAVEDSATVTGNLIPWNSGGVYHSATLGVATLAYLPFNFFCWLSPLVTITFGWLGWTIHPMDDADRAMMECREYGSRQTGSAE